MGFSQDQNIFTSTEVRRYRRQKTSGICALPKTRSPSQVAFPLTNTTLNWGSEHRIACWPPLSQISCFNQTLRVRFTSCSIISIPVTLANKWDLAVRLDTGFDLRVFVRLRRSSLATLRSLFFRTPCDSRVRVVRFGSLYHTRRL